MRFIDSIRVAAMLIFWEVKQSYRMILGNISRHFTVLVKSSMKKGSFELIERYQKNRKQDVNCLYDLLYLKILV